MTKGDFYIGTGPQARWIGSIYHDAFPDYVPCEILTEVNPIMYEEKVLEFLRGDNGRGIVSDDGDEWPWIWPDSNMTDYVYMFDLEVGRVVASQFACDFFDPMKIRNGEDLDDATLAMGKPKFPLMKMEINRDGSYTS